MNDDRLVLLFALAVAAAAAIALAWIPGHTARERGHANAEAINLCGWFSLVFPVLWFVAVIWAHTGPNRSDEVKRQRWEKKHGRRRGFNVVAAERLEEMVYKKPNPMSPDQDRQWRELMER